MAKTLFEMLSGGVSPAEQRQNTKEESAARREANRQEGVQKKRLHTALDMIGLAPGVGEPADLLNMALYGLEGKPKEAAISGAAMVPFVGGVSMASKYAAKYPDLIRLEWARDGIEKYKNIIDATKGTDKALTTRVKRLWSKIDQYLNSSVKKSRQSKMSNPQLGVGDVRKADESVFASVDKEIRDLAGQDEKMSIIARQMDDSVAKGLKVAPPKEIVKKKVKKETLIRPDKFSRTGGGWHRRQ